MCETAADIAVVVVHDVAKLDRRLSTILPHDCWFCSKGSLPNVREISWPDGNVIHDRHAVRTGGDDDGRGRGGGGNCRQRMADDENKELAE